ncbi:hypothetical protein PSPO01_15533 [Paraphaeosphaeria sporulosa]
MDYIDYSSFSTLSSADYATQKSIDCTSSAAATQPKPTTNPTFVQPPFGQLDVFSPGFRSDTNPIASNAAFDLNLSPLSDDSQTHSLCGDALQNAFKSPSPSLSLRPELRRASTGSEFKFEDCPDPSKPPKRKRGRPRLVRPLSLLSSSSSARAQRSQRLPHNQVERKYREGLNVCLERLRKTVPTLCEDKLGRALGHPKPSKAMILEGAIEYIQEIEKERDMYRDFIT